MTRLVKTTQSGDHDMKCSFFQMGQNFARNGLVPLSVCHSGSKLIPWLCIFDESCHWLQFRVDYCVDDGAIFPLFWAKLFTGKLGSHEISNILPPCCQQSTAWTDTPEWRPLERRTLVPITNTIQYLHGFSFTFLNGGGMQRDCIITIGL